DARGYSGGSGSTHPPCPSRGHTRFYRPDSNDSFVGPACAVAPYSGLWSRCTDGRDGPTTVRVASHRSEYLYRSSRCRSGVGHGGSWDGPERSSNPPSRSTSSGRTDHHGGDSHGGS